MEQFSSSNKMTRQDLIMTIISLYPDTFRFDRPEHVQAWVEMYEKAIRKDWNMERLMRYFATDYKSTTVPPPPSFFYQYREDVAPKIQREPLPEITEEERQATRVAYQNFKKNFKNLIEQTTIPED